MNSNKLYLALAMMLGSASLWTSCGPKETAETSNAEAFATQTERLLIKVDTLYSEFENPWGMTWLSDGRMLVTERKGEILIFKDDKFTGEKIEGLPEVHLVNQAGLLDVAAHPKHAENGWIYIAYAKKFRRQHCRHYYYAIQAGW